MNCQDEIGWSVKANRRAESLHKFNNGAGLAIRIWVFFLSKLLTNAWRVNLTEMHAAVLNFYCI